MCLTCRIALRVVSVSWVEDWRDVTLTQSGDRDGDRPRVFADYGHLSGDSTPLLVAKDRRTGMMFAAAVSMKGGGDRNGLMGWDARKSLSEQTESQASVNLSVAFESSVRKERPLWTRSVLQVTLQAMGLLRRSRENDEGSC